MAGNLSSNQIMKLALDGSPDPTLAFSPEGEILFSNAAAINLFDEEASPGRHIRDIAELLGDQDKLLDQFEHAAKHGRAFITEPLPLNARLHYHRRFIPVKSQDAIIGVYLYLRSEENLREHHSDLLKTDSLDLILDSEIENSGRNIESKKIALFMVQIRNLASLRAMYGSDISSTIIEHISLTIRSSLRENDLLFQMSDDRILAVITRYAWKSDLLIIAQRLEDQIAIPFHTKDTVLHILPSIGISMFPDDGRDRETLVRNAEISLIKAVEEEQPFLMYNQEIHEQAMERLVIRGDLNRAIKDKELILHYMPICDKEGHIVGLEALVRWQHPRRGLMMPESFLPIAIHSRIIGTITRWVMYRVIEHQKRELKNFPVYTSFNISALDLSDSFFLDSLKSAMGRQIDPGRLHIEMTENEIMSNFCDHAHKIRLIQDSGIEVMVDDFGTGHSSLTYLNELPAKYLKIDRSFLNDVLEDESSMNFLKLSIEMGHIRKKQVILEGVESKEHWEALRDSGADLFQGFHLGEPLNLKATVALLQKYFGAADGL